MAFGLNVHDQLGNLSLSTANTMRLVEVVAVSTANQNYTVSLTGVDFSNEAFMWFVASSTEDPGQGVFSPSFTSTATTGTITGRGVSGTAYIGVR